MIAYDLSKPDYVEVAPRGFDFRGHAGAKYQLVYYTNDGQWSGKSTEYIEYFDKYETLRLRYKKLGRGDIKNYGVKKAIDENWNEY